VGLPVVSGPNRIQASLAQVVWDRSVQ